MAWTWLSEFALCACLQTAVGVDTDSKDAADDVRLHRRAWGRKPSSFKICLRHFVLLNHGMMNTVQNLSDVPSPEPHHTEKDTHCMHGLVIPLATSENLSGLRKKEGCDPRCWPHGTRLSCDANHKIERQYTVRCLSINPTYQLIGCK